MSATVCTVCTSFREQRDKLISDVGMALGEVTKLRRLNDFYREKIRTLESAQKQTSASSFVRKRLGYAVDVGEAHDAFDSYEDSEASLRDKVRALEAENQMLKQQRDEFSEQVSELNQRLDDISTSLEDKLEHRLSTSRPSEQKAAFEEEFRELKRLRIIMNFSELKKDSDKLHEMLRYVSKLETENAGLNAQVRNLLTVGDRDAAAVVHNKYSKTEHLSPDQLAAPNMPNPSSSVLHKTPPTGAFSRAREEAKLLYTSNGYNDALKHEAAITPNALTASGPAAYELKASLRHNEWPQQQSARKGGPITFGNECETTESRPNTSGRSWQRFTTQASKPESLKKELTTAQELLQLLSNRPVGKVINRPKTAGSSTRWPQ